MRLIYLFTFFIGFASYAQTVQVDWAKSFGGKSTRISTREGIAIDKFNNVYTVGSFVDTVDFDPGPATFNLISNNGLINYYIQKLDSNGSFIWAKRIGGDPDAIKIDATNNLYICGDFFGSNIDFDPGPTVFNLSATVNSFDAFVLKLDSGGNFIWAKSFGGSDDDVATSMDLTNNSVYLSGYFGSTVDFDPNAGVANYSASGFLDAFILKLTTNGVYQWARVTQGQSFGNSMTLGYDIKVSKSGKNVYVVGGFEHDTDFDSNGSGFVLTNSGFFNFNGFLWKLDSTGLFNWAKSTDGTLSIENNGIALDSNENVYLTGYFDGTVDFDPGTNTHHITTNGGSLFIQKLDSSGAFIWARAPSSGGSFGSTMMIDQAQNVYLKGNLEGTIDFDYSSNTRNLTSNGSSDVFIQKVNPQGSHLWAYSFGDSQYNNGLLSINNTGSNIYLAGSFQDTIDVDPNASILNLVPNHLRNVFILKLNQATPISTFVKQIDEFKEFKVYPNPTRGEVHLVNNSISIREIQIRDSSGKMLLSSTISNINSPIEINGPDGLYFVTIINDTGTRTFKIVKTS